MESYHMTVISLVTLQLYVFLDKDQNKKYNRLYSCITAQFGFLRRRPQVRDSSVSGLFGRRSQEVLGGDWSCDKQREGNQKRVSHQAIYSCGQLALIPLKDFGSHCRTGPAIDPPKAWGSWSIDVPTLLSSVEICCLGMLMPWYLSLLQAKVEWSIECTTMVIIMSWGRWVGTNTCALQW